MFAMVALCYSVYVAHLFYHAQKKKSTTLYKMQNNVPKAQMQNAKCKMQN